MQKTPLPTGVREKHGSWHYVQNHQWTKLCRIEEGRGRLYELLFEVAPGTPGSVWHAILSYLKSGMSELKEATQKHYRNDALRMLHHFGHLQLADVEPSHIAQFLKWCRENQRATTGNREKAVLSSVFEFAMAEGWCAFNPCRGVRRNKERPSRRYVEHEILSAALNRAPPELQHLFAIAYLLGIRQTDLRLARQHQIVGNVLTIIESKTGKQNDHEITHTVRHFLELAVQRSRAAGSDSIFTSARGLPWSEWGLQSALRRFGAGFKFRDLRPKAQTDRPDKDVLGHTGQMRERYHKRRKLSAVK